MWLASVRTHVYWLWVNGGGRTGAGTSRIRSDWPCTPVCLRLAISQPGKEHGREHGQQEVADKRLDGNERARGRAAGTGSDAH